MYALAWLEEPNDNLLWCLTRELVDRTKTFQKNNFAAAGRKALQAGEVSAAAALPGEEEDNNVSVTSAGTSLCGETVLGVFQGTDIAKIAFALSTFKIRRTKLVSILTDMAVLRRFQLEPWELSLCVYSFARLYVKDERLYDQLAIGVREKCVEMTGEQLAHCIHGLLRARRQYSTVANVVIPQLIEKFDSLDVPSLATVYDGLSRCVVPDLSQLRAQTGPAEADTVSQAGRLETVVPMLAAHCVQRLHPSLGVATARELARIARACIVLQPEHEPFMQDIFAQSLQKLEEMDDKRLATLLLCLGSQQATSMPQKYDLLRQLLRAADERWTSPGGLVHPSGAKSQLAAAVLLQVLRAFARCESWFSGQYTEGFLSSVCQSLALSAEYLNAKNMMHLSMALLRLQLPHLALLRKLDYYMKMKRHNFSEEGLSKTKHALAELAACTGRWTGTVGQESSSTSFVLAEVPKGQMGVLHDVWGRSARTKYSKQHSED
eukprot:GHVS01081634.1.p1 GENE.GHVS01081634.1~~GHVS01081634.1.p1  ORF type:complete len:538 (-),score=65.12 GHVS01081634.1:24-1499(-)